MHISSQIDVLYNHILVDQRAQVAVLVVLLYDAIITMEEEVELFWYSTFRNRVDYIYFVNRCAGILGAVAKLFWDIRNPNLETQLFQMDLNYRIIIVSVNYILLIRVLALYEWHPKLSMLLTAFLCLEGATELAVTLYGTWNQRISLSAVTDVLLCGTESPFSLTLAIVTWTLPMISGLLFMVLALYKASGYLDMTLEFKWFKSIRVVIVQQTMYFLLLVSCCILNVLAVKFDVKNVILAAILRQTGNPSLLCILSSRLLINMRATMRRGSDQGTIYGVDPTSNLKFGEIGTRSSLESDAT